MIKTLKTTKEEILKYNGTSGSSEAFWAMDGNLRLNYSNTISPWRGTAWPEKIPVRSVGTRYLDRGVYEVTCIPTLERRFILLPDSSTIVETEDDIYEIAEKILQIEMPGNYWINRSNGCIYLRYPSITLTNDTGETHTVEDLIIKLSVNNTQTCFNAMYGWRAALSQREVNNIYGHSHLRQDLYNFQSFCMGSGTPMSKIYEKAKISLTPAEFGLYLAQLNAYLSWESLEGNPYISISNLKSVTPLTDTASNGVYSSNQIIRKFAILVIEQLTPDMITHNNGDNYLSLSSIEISKKMFEIERKVTEMLAASIHSSDLLKYNLSMNSYMLDNARNGSNSRPPTYGDLPLECRQVLEHWYNRTFRIIPETVEKSTDETILRVSHAFFRRVVKEINNIFSDIPKLNGNI